MPMLTREMRRRQLLSAIGVALGLALEYSVIAQQPASPIKSDEVVVFYPTLARRAADAGAWRVAVHGSIFEPEERSLKRGLFVASLREALPGTWSRQEEETFDRRVRLLLVDSERGKTIPIRLGSLIHQVGPSGEDGHFRGEIRLSREQMAAWLGREPPADAWAAYSAVMPRRDRRAFEGRVLVMAPDGLSVVSDIDDTIKVSEVRNRKELLANSFLRPFRAVPGMAEVYRTLATGKATFHYVSGSPWQLYPALADFLRDAGLPQGTFHLKSVRFVDSSVLNLLGSQQEFKLGQIEPLLAAFPRRRFVLVGDSGEQDPEIYGALARKRPDQVLAIWIRDVSGESADNERCRAAFQDVTRSRWRLFSDPAELREPAQRILSQSRENQGVR